MANENDILEFADNMLCQDLHMVIDHKTGLKGIIAIHNTKLGPSLGGCRWLEYNSTQEATFDAIRLAQGMSYKSALAGLKLGGGKAVLLKPKGSIDKKAYFQAFGRFLNKLNGRYITAVDSGSSAEHMDLISTVSNYVTCCSKASYSYIDPSPLTSFGVFRSIQASVKHKLKTDDLKGLRVSIQGLGHVGKPLVEMLVEAGAKVTGFDVNKKVAEECQKKYKIEIVKYFEDFIKIPSDIFSPCALGGILNPKNIQNLDTKIIAGAANNQLETPERDITLLEDKNILYAPDFVTNAGGIIYVAGDYYKETEQKTKDKISHIYDTLIEIFQRSYKTNISTYDVAHHIALERLSGDHTYAE